MAKKTASRWMSHIGTVTLVALFCSGLFSRCANMGGTLQGGPKDTLPPRVVSMTPPFNSVNLVPTKIVIGFDEYVQLKDLSTEFFTSPFTEKKPSVTIKNRTAVITVDTPLDSATTYVFNLGSSIVDNNEGNPLHGLKYTFSTGGHIDSMFMSGFVSNALTADTVKGAYVFFYDARLDTLPQDSLLFDLWRASAVGKTMPNGGFIHSNLKPMDYRVYAVLDQNGNQIYDPGTDEVAFMDGVYNPADMPSFMMWRDTVLGYTVAEPQLHFRSFIEDPDRRQNLTMFSRPSAQQIMLRFSSKNPEIESLVFEGIDSARVIREYARENRDSILYWLDVPADELPDTILGRIVYQRHDSVGTLYAHEQDLRFAWRKPFVAPKEEEKGSGTAVDSLALASGAEERPLSRREQRRRMREQKAGLGETEEEQKKIDEILGEETPVDSLAADTLPKSLMKYSFSQENPVIPGISPVLSFELPVRRFDPGHARLYMTKEEPQKGMPQPRSQLPAEPDGSEAKEQVEVAFSLENDSVRIREYILQCDWKDGGEYTLVIPRGAIETIDGELNDSIRQVFRVAKESEMGSVILNMNNPEEGVSYILQMLDERGDKQVREVPYLTRTDTVHYIPPGKIRLRLVLDRNNNGKWDTGDLVRRIQPEKVRWYVGEIGRAHV